VDGPVALSQAGLEFGDRLRRVTADDWGRATPCDEWSVYDLVNHVVGGNVRYTMILEEADPGAVLATHGADAIGSDPVGAFESGLRRVTDAFSSAGALTRTVTHPKSGRMSGAQLRVLRVNELTVHAWDLARAIGVDERLDDGLAQWLCDNLDTVADVVTRSPLFAPPVALDASSAAVQVRLLRQLGRRP